MTTTHPHPVHHPVLLTDPIPGPDHPGLPRDWDGDGPVPVGFHGTLTLTTHRPLPVRVLAVLLAGAGVLARPVARVVEPVLVTAAWLALPAAGIAYLTGHPDTVGLGATPHPVWWLTPLAAAGVVLVGAVTADLIAHHHAQTRTHQSQARARVRARSGDRW